MTQPPPTPKAIVTDAMLDAGRTVVHNAAWDGPINELLVAIYSAMHAARPPMKVVRADPIVFEPDDASPNPEASEIMREALEVAANALDEVWADVKLGQRSGPAVANARRKVRKTLSSICKGEREGG